MNDRFKAKVELLKPAVLKDWERNLVLRCSAKGGPDCPKSVIIKKIKGSLECGFTDWASLEFLTKTEGLDEISPCFYGGDEKKRFFLQEDLGDSRDLADVLSKGDVDVTEKMLIKMSAQMGRLAGRTLRKSNVFTSIRRRYPEWQKIGRHCELAKWEKGLGSLKEWCQALNLKTPYTLESCLAIIADVYSNPSECLAFSHGDPAPTNNHIKGGSLRLIDFEYGAFRHAFYDITGWNVLCPLPEQWVDKMSQTFRNVLSEYIPRASDDQWYNLQWALICAYRALAMIAWIPTTILEKDRPRVGEWSMREAMLSTCLRLSQVTSGITLLKPLQDFGDMFADTLQLRWPELGDGRINWPGMKD